MLNIICGVFTAFAVIGAFVFVVTLIILVQEYISLTNNPAKSGIDWLGFEMGFFLLAIPSAALALLAAPVIAGNLLLANATMRRLRINETIAGAWWVLYALILCRNLTTYSSDFFLGSPWFYLALAIAPALYTCALVGHHRELVTKPHEQETRP